MTPSTCIACGASQEHATPMSCTTSEGVRTDYTRCSSCGLLAMTPLPTEEAVAAAYSSTYYGLGETKFPVWFERLRERSAQNAALRVHAIRGCEPGSVLDIGCGSGTFLAALGSLGHAITGSEYGGPALERTRQVPNITVHEGHLDQHAFEKSSFDVITLWHVLEHLPRPDETLAWCAGWLKPGGILMVEVPNAGSWQAAFFGKHWLHLDPPRHLYQFTPEALEKMLNRHGFFVSSKETSSFQMGAFGVMQSAQNALLSPRDLFYNLLLSRGRTEAPLLKKVVAVFLAALFALPAVLFTFLEEAAGRGSVVRVTCEGRGEVSGHRHS